MVRWKTSRRCLVMNGRVGRAGASRATNNICTSGCRKANLGFAPGNVVGVVRSPAQAGHRRNSLDRGGQLLLFPLQAPAKLRVATP